MKQPRSVNISVSKRRRISAIRGQGFKKSILEVKVISPSGGERVVAWSEDPHPGLDKRRRGRKNPDWVTIWSKHAGGLELAYRVNVKTGQPGFRVWGHAHQEYFPLGPEMAALLSTSTNYQVSNLLEAWARQLVNDRMERRRKYLYSRRYKPGKREQP